MNPEDLSKVRQNAHKFLRQLPATDVTSDGRTAALFTTLTGQSHDGLLAIWKAEDVAKAERRKEGKSLAGLPTTTTCNLFVGLVGAAIGSTIPLGQFDIEKKLKAAGLGEAWIPATSGKRPGYGDPFKPKKFHMGVSVEFIGDMWHTAESGQGGPGQDYTKGRDIIRRKQTPWDPSSLEGWVDIDILMRILQKSPQWMIGWWRFKVGTAEEFVYLPERGVARSFPEAPKNIKLPVTVGGKAGSLTHDDDTLGVAIAWPDNVTDSLRRLPGMDYMIGQRGAPQLQAFRLK